MDNREKGVSRFSVVKSSSQRTNNFIRKPLCVSETSRIEEIGLRTIYHKFFVEKFCSHCTKTFRRGTLVCFRRLKGSKILLIRKGDHDFLMAVFSRIETKIFVDEHFRVSEDFWCLSNLYLGGRRRYHNFRS